MIANDVHKKIQALSRKHEHGTPPIFTETLAKELGVTSEQLRPYLKTLKDFGFIKFNDISDVAIVITDLGQAVVVA